ncbi:N-acetylmuramoyl-L-alanine amidase CwlD [Alkaliphilus crotonatoxidans]
MYHKNIFIVMKLHWKRIGVISTIIIFLMAAIAILFSKTSQYWPIFNNTSTGAVVIDPGHGGIDGGSSHGDLLEKDINLEVALKLEAILKEINVETVMTRDEDISLESKSELRASRYKRDLHARKEIIDNDGALFVSIHVNAHKNSNSRGIYIFHYPNATASRQLAEAIQVSIEEQVVNQYLKTDQIKVQISGADYYVLRESKIPGVIVEIGFITNSLDRELIQSEEYQYQMARAMAQGIINYLTEKK